MGQWCNNEPRGAVKSTFLAESLREADKAARQANKVLAGFTADEPDEYLVEVGRLDLGGVEPHRGLNRKQRRALWFGKGA